MKNRLENLATSIKNPKMIGDSATKFATNLFLAKGIMQGSEYLASTADFQPAEIGLGAALAGASMYKLNQSKALDKSVKYINQKIRDIKGSAMPYLRNATLAAYLTLAGCSVSQPIAEAVSNIKSKYEVEKEQVILDEASTENEAKASLMKIITNDRRAKKGRFDRTFRWDEAIDKAEAKYDIEKGIIAGTIMQESYGNPVQLPKNHDAGAGLMMFQPGTANHYGLKVLDDCKFTGADSNHGKKLKRIADSLEYNYGELSKIDERFHPKKSIEAGAKFLKDLYKRYGDWDKAISAYNSGTPEENFKETNHVKMVREFQEFYNQNDTIQHN